MSRSESHIRRRTARLVVLALGQTSDGEAIWDGTVTLPEPTSGLLGAVALLVTALIRRRRSPASTWRS